MRVIGQPLERVDGVRKVTGAAPYAAEHAMDGLCHSYLVQSQIGRGEIVSLDTAEAEREPGVLLILTHENTPQLFKVKQEEDMTCSGQNGETFLQLQDAQIHYWGQNIALVVAETYEQARAAAAKVRVRYKEAHAITSIEEALPEATFPPKLLEPLQAKRGDVDAALADAPVTQRLRYDTPIEHHNAMEPHATVCVWREGALTVYEASQWVNGARKVYSDMLGLPLEQVRILSPFVGGGFGSKGATWQHGVLTAVAARQLGRPVKLVLDRPQMFPATGHRPRTQQEMTLGADENGKLLALRHATTTDKSRVGMYIEGAGLASRMLYSVPNMEMSHRVVPVDLSVGRFMRAPGEAPGMFALECFLDELAVRLDLDPVELRLRNYAERDEHEDRPWSSKHLRECYRRGADAIGWKRRKAEPGSVCEGHELIGYGMATATYPGKSLPVGARVRLLADGTAVVSTASHELGTGTYTVMAQVAAEALHLRPEQVVFELGDTLLPRSSPSFGSLTAASVGPAVWQTSLEALERLKQTAVSDAQSPLHGCPVEALEAGEGVLCLRGEPNRTDSYAAVVGRTGLAALEVERRVTSDNLKKKDAFSFHSFGAIYVKARVDRNLGTVRLEHMVGAVDVGRVLNLRTARSQVLGALVWGAGMALMEETVIDHRSGRYITHDLAEYHVPVNADIQKMEALFVNEPDRQMSEVGARGLGEIGNTGTAAAIANAIFNACGVRVRSLPILPEKVLSGLAALRGVRS